MRLTYFLIGIFLCAMSTTGFAQSLPYVLSQKEQAIVRDQLLEDKFRSVLPSLMRREKVDMWVIIGREYNEDPVMKTMLPSTWLSARRRTILLIFDPGPGKELEALAIARYDVGTLFKKAWDPEKQPDQWARLAEVIEERKPQVIGLNKSVHYAHADGISATEYEAFMQALPKKHHSKVAGVEKLAVAWLETRTEREMVAYEHACRIAHAIIAEGFSEKVIQPGVTTTDDVVWWYRERIAELKLEAWFHPTVDVQRADPLGNLYAFSGRPGFNVIQPGDLVHVDFGITYVGLNTDTQQLAYVLKPGEQEAPVFLRDALRMGNRAQDILTAQFAEEKTGNQILADALAQAAREGNNVTIYTHPIGYHGHAAGPTIGMWDNQGRVEGTGDYPVYKNTAYSIELNTRVMVKEWGKEIRVMLEEEAFFDGEKVRYIDGRQTELLLIPRQTSHLNQQAVPLQAEKP
jgi:Xaa-Pro aminopeptidase